uniref:Putative ovule protein n=1 Tax=Solanum chacoense TaxID=4108 RepID=A0A0V0GYL6_SOLCH
MHLPKKRTRVCTMAGYYSTAGAGLYKGQSIKIFYVITAHNLFAQQLCNSCSFFHNCCSSQVLHFST